MSETPLTKIAVVGCSLAGLRAAEELRRRGYEGHLSLIGAEAHFPPYDRPPLSKDGLSTDWDLEEARLPLFEEIDAELHLGQAAVGLDMDRRRVRLADGRDVDFDGLIVATGAGVRRLRCPGAELPQVLHFRDVEDCVKLRDLIAPGARAAIVGAGFIGSEVASVCREQGLDVVMVDAAELPLREQVGPEIATFLMDQHRARGVDVRLGVGVAAIEGDGRVERLCLSDGTAIDVDLVVVGIGVSPATDWLADSPLRLEDGVECDQHCRAIDVEGVVVAGDVARWWNPLYGRSMRVEHWTNAVEQAEYAARALLGEVTTPGYGSIPYFWSYQYDLHVQFAGVPGDTCEIVEGALEDRKFVMEVRTADTVVGVLAVNWPARFQRARRALTDEATRRAGTESPLTDSAVTY